MSASAKRVCMEMDEIENLVDIDTRIAKLKAELAQLEAKRGLLTIVKGTRRKAMSAYYHATKGDADVKAAMVMMYGEGVKVDWRQVRAYTDAQFDALSAKEQKVYYDKAEII